MKRASKLLSNDSKRIANPLTMRFSAPWQRWMLSHEGKKPPVRSPKPKNRDGPGVPVAERLRQAQSFQKQLARGKSQADIARDQSLTRARVTQIMKLLHLSPRIQAYILSEKTRIARMTERSLRPILALSFEEQESWARRILQGYSKSTS
jgi:hypothetical protein